MYYFVDWVQTPDGKVAALPEDTGYAELAQHHHADFALFECERLEKEQITERIIPVSHELADLLEAAKQYAPALALSRNDLARQKPTTHDTFQQIMVDTLKHHLQRQSVAPYVMAKAAVTETGYKYAGAYYWIVGYNPAKVNWEVSWVSRDFFVYHDPPSHFDVDKALLKERFGRPRNE